MKDYSADDTVIDRLRGAIDADVFPKAAQDYAEHLLNRISKPVRVSVFGSPSAGKSELINMFVGRQVLTNKRRLPTTEIVYGPVEAMTVTDANGKNRRYEEIDLTHLGDKDLAFLQLELPVDLLKRINLLEVVTDGGIAELASATEWAVRRTDIALWCSQEFSVDEQTIWTRVPDSLKDHAFLVLTKADILSGEKVLSKRVAALETVVSEEFHSLFAVATLQAISAHRSDGIVEEAMYHASGGGALASEVLRHAERGRRADYDSAHMFLARYNVKDIGPITEAAKTAAPARLPETASVVELAVTGTANADSESGKPEDSEGLKTPVVTNITLFSDAVRFLKRRGGALTELADELGDGNAKGVLGQCVDAVEYLIDLFSQDESGCEAADNFIDELAEAQDVMVLMQVESGDAPAADAAILLLQLRRDMEMQLAA